jgi:hypothetical protein
MVYLRGTLLPCTHVPTALHTYLLYAPNATGTYLLFVFGFFSSQLSQVISNHFSPFSNSNKQINLRSNEAYQWARSTARHDGHVYMVTCIYPRKEMKYRLHFTLVSTVHPPCPQYHCSNLRIIYRVGSSKGLQREGPATFDWSLNKL